MKTYMKMLKLYVIYNNKIYFNKAYVITKIMVKRIRKSVIYDINLSQKLLF